MELVLIVVDHMLEKVDMTDFGVGWMTSKSYLEEK
jgi:hypothetical protein